VEVPSEYPLPHWQDASGTRFDCSLNFIARDGGWGVLFANRAPLLPAYPLAAIFGAVGSEDSTPGFRGEFRRIDELIGEMIPTSRTATRSG